MYVFRLQRNEFDDITHKSLCVIVALCLFLSIGLCGGHEWDVLGLRFNRTSMTNERGFAEKESIFKIQG